VIRIVGHPVIDDSGISPSSSVRRIDITDQIQARVKLEKALARSRNPKIDSELSIDTIPTMSWSNQPDAQRNFSATVGLTIQGSQGKRRGIGAGRLHFMPMTLPR